MQVRIETLISLALEEDAPFGDLTSRSIFAADHLSTATITAREDMVVCGLDIARQVFRRVDPSTNVELKASDGARLSESKVLMQIEGPTIALLTAERVALNFLQRLSGIASVSRRFADAADETGTGVRIVDTRKTTPGWRALEKYAVRCGGCYNHRASLSEHVLIKENHIHAAGSIAEAVRRSRAIAPHCSKIEVEVENLAEVSEALTAGAEIIMLDNMPPSLTRQAVALIDGAAIIEASGGIDLNSLAEYAVAGVDIISVGALTHSASSVDMSMIITHSSGS